MFLCVVLQQARKPLQIFRMLQQPLNLLCSSPLGINGLRGQLIRSSTQDLPGYSLLQILQRKIPVQAHSALQPSSVQQPSPDFFDAQQAMRLWLGSASLLETAVLLRASARTWPDLLDETFALSAWALLMCLFT